MINRKVISGKRNLIISALLSLMFVSKAFSQTIVLPDTNFRNVLLQKYPSVMSGNELDTTAAHAFMPDLLIPNANISDLTGVQYFTSLYKIDATNNNLTTLPDLSASKNLAYLYLNQNQVDTLDFLLKNTTLVQLQLFNNRLTYFPELPGFTKLQQLLLSGNQIDTLSGMSYLMNLTDLEIGDNRLNSLPDLSGNTKLIYLHFHKNNIKDVEQLALFPKLQQAICWGNPITDLSSLNNNTTLTTLYAFENELQALPVLSNKPNLIHVYVEGNYLTFEDLLPVARLSNVTDFIYAPQDSVGETTSLQVRSLDPLMFIVQTDSSLDSNVYIWYKDTTVLDSGSSAKFFIPRIDSSYSGTYYAAITNPALPLLRLEHRPWKVSVLPCMDLLSSGYTVVSKDCKEGTTLKMEVATNGALPPLTYTLKNSSGEDSIRSATDYVSSIPPGQYVFSVTDLRNCRLTANPELTIYKTADCDPVIAPFSGGQQSTYFIENSGRVRILDMGGNVIRELNAPAVWDGTRSDGTFVDAGYYVITINDKKLTNISVLR